jgi:modulator of FtsH protease
MGAVSAALAADTEARMQEVGMSALHGWESFYVIIGSSAGALTGLTFVAVSLVAELRLRGAERGIAAFTTPTIVHFGVVLFVCALLSAPWPNLVLAAVVLGLCGLAGTIYSVIVTRRLRLTDTYTLVLEDWLANAIGPLVAYLALVVGAALLPGNTELALFVIAGALLLLLFDGIHNAWDVTTYLTVEQVLRQGEREETKD